MALLSSQRSNSTSATAAASAVQLRSTFTLICTYRGAPCKNVRPSRHQQRRSSGEDLLPPGGMTVRRAPRTHPGSRSRLTRRRDAIRIVRRGADPVRDRDRRRREILNLVSHADRRSGAMASVNRLASTWMSSFHPTAVERSAAVAIEAVKKQAVRICRFHRAACATFAAGTPRLLREALAAFLIEPELDL